MASLGRLLQLSRQSGRTFATTAVRRSGPSQEGIPGANLPFSINNRYKLTAYFILYFATGFAAPFIVVRHQLLKP